MILHDHEPQHWQRCEVGDGHCGCFVLAQRPQREPARPYEHEGDKHEERQDKHVRLPAEHRDSTLGDRYGFDKGDWKLERP